MGSQTMSTPGATTSLKDHCRGRDRHQDPCRQD